MPTWTDSSPQPTLVARPSADWHLYDADRSMPWKEIPGVAGTTATRCAGRRSRARRSLTSPRGRDVMLYSGGNFAGFYGIGRIARDAAGRWTDLTPTPADALLGPQPDAGVVGPGTARCCNGTAGRTCATTSAPSRTRPPVRDRGVGLGSGDGPAGAAGSLSLDAGVGDPCTIGAGRAGTPPAAGGCPSTEDAMISANWIAEPPCRPTDRPGSSASSSGSARAAATGRRSTRSRR